jgi:hypothetical protein
MNIIDTFATHITDRIEPVVKVADRNPSRLLYELSNLIVTPQWEQHLRRMFDAWAEVSDGRAGVDPGIWISGFFGSGKSLLMKMLGIVLEGNELEGQHVDDIFLLIIRAFAEPSSQAAGPGEYRGRTVRPTERGSAVGWHSRVRHGTVPSPLPS